MKPDLLRTALIAACSVATAHAVADDHDDGRLRIQALVALAGKIVRIALALIRAHHRPTPDRDPWVLPQKPRIPPEFATESPTCFSRGASPARDAALRIRTAG